MLIGNSCFDSGSAGADVGGGGKKKFFLLSPRMNFSY